MRELGPRGGAVLRPGGFVAAPGEEDPDACGVGVSASEVKRAPDFAVAGGRGGEDGENGVIFLRIEKERKG